MLTRNPQDVILFIYLWDEPVLAPLKFCIIHKMSMAPYLQYLFIRWWIWCMNQCWQFVSCKSFLEVKSMGQVSLAGHLPIGGKMLFNINQLEVAWAPQNLLMCPILSGELYPPGLCLIQEQLPCNFGKLSRKNIINPVKVVICCNSVYCSFIFYLLHTSHCGVKLHCNDFLWSIIRCPIHVKIHLDIQVPSLLLQLHLVLLEQLSLFCFHNVSSPSIFLKW